MLFCRCFTPLNFRTHNAHGMPHATHAAWHFVVARCWGSKNWVCAGHVFRLSVGIALTRSYRAWFAFTRRSDCNDVNGCYDDEWFVDGDSRDQCPPLRCVNAQQHQTSKISFSRTCTIPNFISYIRFFLRCFRAPIQVSRIENRVPTGPYRVPNIFLKKTLSYIYYRITFYRLKCFTCCVSTRSLDCMRTKQRFAQCEILLEATLHATVCRPFWTWYDNIAFLVSLRTSKTEWRKNSLSSSHVTGSRWALTASMRRAKRKCSWRGLPKVSARIAAEVDMCHEREMTFRFVEPGSSSCVLTRLVTWFCGVLGVFLRMSNQAPSFPRSWENAYIFVFDHVRVLSLRRTLLQWSFAKRFCFFLKCQFFRSFCWKETELFVGCLQTIVKSFTRSRV